MKKIFAILLVSVMMFTTMAASTSALIPFPGTNILTVTQDGKPIPGVTFELYRVSQYQKSEFYGENDTFLGTYTTDAKGTLTASHLTTGLYYWMDEMWVTKTVFRVTGAGYVHTYVDLPTSIESTVTTDSDMFGVSGEITVKADLSGGFLGEINDYGTVFLYSTNKGLDLAAIGFTLTKAEYDEESQYYSTYETFKKEDGVISVYEEGEYGYTAYMFMLTDGVYYELVVENTEPDAAKVLARLTVTAEGFPEAAEPADFDLPVPDPEDDGHEQMTYMSPDGFQLRYNALTVESRELDDHAAEFVYLGEGNGANKVTVRWIEGKQPEEALYDTTFAWGDQEQILRTEGFFPGTTDKWGYWRTYTDAGLTKCAIAGEYNGGVLMFVVESVLTGDEETDMTVSDTLAELIDSVTYFDFGEQTMYSYIPGVYASAGEDGAEYRVTLNTDHTGTLSFQDTAPILWGSTELTADGTTWAYTIEGDNLYVDLDGEWVEFARQTAE